MKNPRNPYARYLERMRSVAASPAIGRVGTEDIAQGTIERALASAGLDTRAVLRGVTRTIEEALASAGLTSRSSAEREAPTTIEAVAVDVTMSTDVAPDGTLIGPLPPDERARPGEFVTRSFSSEFGSRRYKLYVPAGYAHTSQERVPLVVMLHGCTQDPEDFAAGTRMNALADRHGFVVVYPAQETHANGSKCWNWFRREDQSRDRGEPALISGITRDVAAGYRIDERRMFVAGLSAGASMAVVLAATYPELYAAAGVHSGLPYACARDVPSALAAMQGGGLGRTPLSRGAPAGPAVPTIIFHGDRDVTVSASNAVAIVEQARDATAGDTVLNSTVYRGTSPKGRAYTRTVFADGSRRSIIEHWVLHGAGHAWSGGSAAGSFTDPTGPDASSEMVRFFYSQQYAGTA